MRRGFTIIELLVASLLLGMLMTILTMIFNQSSIAWRTGMAGVQDMDKVRENVAEVREEADNAFLHGDKMHRILGLWREDGSLRKRTCDVDEEDQKINNAAILEDKIKLGAKGAALKPQDFIMYPVGDINSAGKHQMNYTVNVKSDGPDGKPNTWDDIWSWPDEW